MEPYKIWPLPASPTFPFLPHATPASPASLLFLKLVQILHISFRYPHGSFPHLLQGSTQMLPLQKDIP